MRPWLKTTMHWTSRMRAATHDPIAAAKIAELKQQVRQLELDKASLSRQLADKTAEYNELFEC